MYPPKTNKEELDTPLVSLLYMIHLSSIWKHSKHLHDQHVSFVYNTYENDKKKSK